MRSRGAGRTWIALLCIAVSGCRGKAEPDIAELSEILSGKAERSAEGTPWRASRAGDRFRTGDGVRTSADGGARLRFLAGGGLRMGPSTTIRFGAGQLAVEGELEAEAEDAVVELVVGRAHIAAGSRIRIGRNGEKLRFDVLVGSAVVTSAGDQVAVIAGESVEVDPAAHTALRARPAEPAAPPPPGDSRAAVVAELRGRPGKLRRPGAGDDWTPLPAGRHELAAGAEIGTAHGNRLELSRAEERVVALGAADLVIAPGGPSGPLAEARRGRTEVRATAVDVTVKVPGGRIVARRGRGSVADVRVERGSTRVVVTGGVVDVAGDQGGRERLLVGQSGVIERDGGLRVVGRPPDRADFGVDAGLTATIHDPAPPTDVKIRFPGKCAEAGVVELAEAGSFRAARVTVQGRGAAIARLARGSHRYRVRCFEGDAIGEEVVASGTLRVVADSGTRPLARGAPHNTVDADGRRYTVLYQNRLPAIRFRWPGAPEADSYRLVVSPRKGRPITVASPISSRTFDSGELAEGPYEFWFVAPALGRESRRSALTIDFDNAASSGYVQSPRPSGGWSGLSVPVSGAAIEGWRVAVAGTPLRLDRQHRFSSQVSRRDDENGIAVEFSHPTHGVHLYVRRGRR